MTTAADTVIATLADAGVTKIFGVIGTSTLDLVDAIARESRLEFVPAREEEAAAHMADGYARATGRVGVVLCHVGPGAVRQMYGVGTAFKDSVPLVAMTGNEVLRATDSTMREGYHVVDILDLYRPITKATLQLREGRDAGAVTARALWLAASGRPGPVLLDLPKSALKEEIGDAEPTPAIVADRVPAVRPGPDPADIDRIVGLLGGAARPVVLAGGGIHFSAAHDALATLASRRNLAVLTTDGGRGSIPEDHPQALGVIARQAGDLVARTLLGEADVIIALGTPFSDVSTFEWSAWSPDAHVVQVDISAEVGGKGTPSEVRVVADARTTLDTLDAALEDAGYRFTGSWDDLREQLTDERASYLAAAAQRGEDGVNPWTLVEELDDALPRDAFVSVDSGMHSFYGKKLRVLAPRTYIRSAGFGAMGYSFPALLGALESAPERRAVAVVGDGCLHMCLGEFETAARRGSRVTVVVCNDLRFASQQSHQRRRFEGRVLGTDFHDTDYAAVAEAQGVRGWVARDDDGARAAIREALAHDGPAVVDARLDRAIQPTTWIEGSGDRRLGASTGA